MATADEGEQATDVPMRCNRCETPHRLLGDTELSTLHQAELKCLKCGAIMLQYTGRRRLFLEPQ